MNNASVPWFLLIDPNDDRNRLGTSLGEIARVRAHASIDAAVASNASSWALVVIEGSGSTDSAVADMVRSARAAFASVPIVAIAKGASDNLVNAAADALATLRIAPVPREVIVAHALAARAEWYGLHDAIGRVVASTTLEAGLTPAQAQLLALICERDPRGVLMRERGIGTRGYEALVARLLRTLGFVRFDDLRIELLRRALSKR